MATELPDIDGAREKNRLMGTPYTERVARFYDVTQAGYDFAVSRDYLRYGLWDDTTRTPAESRKIAMKAMRGASAASSGVSTRACRRRSIVRRNIHLVTR